MTAATHPTVLWSQTDSVIYVTIETTNPKDVQQELTENSLKLKFKEDGKQDKEVELVFFDDIDVTGSAHRQHRLLEYVLKKKTEGEEWKRLLKDEHKKSWLKVDWSKYKDSDDELKPSPFDMSQFSNFENEEKDSDDEEEDLPDLEHEKVNL
jgi:CS domain